jgi:GTP-binding protein
MVPSDTKDIKKEFNILINELREYNPELLDKHRILAISKSDFLDEELERELEAELPENIPHIFISAVTGKGIPQLKDLIWKELEKSILDR